jgi:hypothetical protein
MGAHRYHDDASLEQGADDLELVDRNWTGAADHSPQPAMSVAPDRVPLPLQLGGALRFQLATDELRGSSQRRVVLVHLHLGYDGGHAPRRSHPAQGVLQRLLHHVSDPAGSGGHQHAQRQRRRVVARQLVSHQLVAHLWTVAVHHADRPAVTNQIHDWTEALARVSELVVDVGALTGRCQCVAADRDDRKRVLLALARDA